MQITDVRVRRVNGGGKTRALASVTFDAEFVVHELRVVEGANGLFVAMPSRKNTRGEYRDIAHPIASHMRNYIQEAVLAQYAEVVREASAGPAERSA